MSMDENEFDFIALLNKYDEAGKSSEVLPIDCYSVVELVSSISGYTTEQLKSKTRTAELSDWRHIAMFLIYNYSSLSYKQTGDIFNRKHDNIIYACNRIKESFKGFNMDLEKKFRIAENVFKIQFNIL